MPDRAGRTKAQNFGPIGHDRRRQRILSAGASEKGTVLAGARKLRGINAPDHPSPALSFAAHRSRARYDARPPNSNAFSCGNRASVCACAPSSVPKRQEQTRARPRRQSAAEWRPSSCRCVPFHDRPRLVKSTSRPAVTSHVAPSRFSSLSCG